MEGGGEGRRDAVWLGGGDVIIVGDMLAGGTVEGSEVEVAAECVG